MSHTIEVPALIAEVRQLRAARDRVLALHQPARNWRTVNGEKHEVCEQCGDPYGWATIWPCQTVTALEGETP